MIPPAIADDIKAAFPNVKLLHAETDIFQQTGLGVEIQINGAPVRNAWLFTDTPANWQRGKAKALTWLAGLS